MSDDDMDKWAERLAEVVATYGTDAAEVVLAVGRIGAGWDLAYGFALLALFGLGCWIIVLLRRWARKLLKEENRDEIPVALGIVVFVCGGNLMLAVGAGFYLLNPFNWVGLWRPEVYLAAKALGWS